MKDQQGWEVKEHLVGGREGGRSVQPGNALQEVMGGIRSSSYATPAVETKFEWELMILVI